MRHLTVRELREALARLNDDAEVWISVGTERDDLHLELTISAVEPHADDLVYLIGSYEE